MKTQLAPMMVEDGLGIKRLTLLQTADIMAYIRDLHPKILEEIKKEFGSKEVKAALNDLEDAVKLYRP